MQAIQNKPHTIEAGVQTRPSFAPAILTIAMLVIAACGDRSSDSEATVFTAGNQQVIEPNPSEGVIGLFPNPNSADVTTGDAADNGTDVGTVVGGDANATDADDGNEQDGLDDQDGLNDQDGNDSQSGDSSNGQGDDSGATIIDNADSNTGDSADGETGNGDDNDAGLVDDGAVDDGASNGMTAPVTSDPALPVVVNVEENVNQLSLEGVEFDQMFQPQQLSYTASVPYLVSSTTLVVNGQEVQDVELVDGNNTILLQSPNNGPVYNISIQRELRENFSPVAYIKDPASTLNTRFGTDVSVDGEWMAILGRNVNQGVILQRQLGAGVWVQDQVLDAAGDSLSINGDVLAVGDTMSGGREIPGFSFGVVRIFERVATGWQQLAVVQASNRDDADRFGHSVAVSGDTLVVGAPGEDSGATGINGDGGRNDALEAGAVYVFQRSNPGQWMQQAYIKGDATGGGDRFGYSVAIEAERMIVGAVLEESSSRGVNGDQLDNGRNGSGAVYVFERSDGNWRQQAYLKAANADVDDHFGHDVDIQGGRVAVSAIAEDSGSLSDPFDNSVRDSGAVYLFDESIDGWQQSAYLKASNPGDTDSFGDSVALQRPEGNALAVGAPEEDASGPFLDGLPQDNSVPDNGAVYVFARSSDAEAVWDEILYLHADNQDSGDGFGSAVAFDTGNLVIGAPGESANPQTGPDPSDNSLAGAGAIYLFR